MDKIKLDVIGHGDLTSQPWEDGWDAIHGIAEAVREGVIDPDSRVEGKLRVSVASRSEVAAVNERFGLMNVEVDEEVMQFEDKAVCEAFASGGMPISKSAFTAMTSLDKRLADNSNVKSFFEINDTKITRLTDGVFYNTGIKVFPLLNIKSTSNFVFQGSNLIIFYPNLNSWPRLSGGNFFKLLDFGTKVSSIADITLYQQTCQHIICRTLVPPIFVDRVNLADPLHIFVPSSSVSAYKSETNWSTYASKIFPISGPEWIAEFGSADEYADIDKYVTDPAEREKIKEAYRNA